MWINEEGRKAYKGNYDTDKLLAEIAKKDEMINKHWKVVVHNQEQVIAELKRQKEKDNGYFGCICEALNISHDSSLVEILEAIEALEKSNE